jgi:hypothetical protein
MKKLWFFMALFFSSISLFAKNKKFIDPIKAVPGQIVFSNTPFPAGAASAKKTFSSSEYIYGKLELSSGTLKEAFKIKDKENTLAFLKSTVTILQNGEVISYGTSNDYIYLKEDIKNGSSLNFDVMPEPAKASTVFSMLDDFSAGIGFTPLPTMIFNAHLPDGNYQVKVKIYTETMDAYGSLQSEDKWPSLEGEFSYNFKEDDAEKILANRLKIRENILENAFRYDKLPPVFSNPGKLTDPNATAAKIAAILKRDLPDREIIKWVAETYNGPVWHIANDDYGLPKYKYFNPHIWMVYKMNGKCYVGDATLRQPYSGGGTYGTLQVAYTSASSVPDKGIDCVKVK